MNGQPTSIPVVDVDNAFPAMVERPTGRRSSAVPGDLGPQVESALRDVLGWRPRAEDPGAFTAALTAAFRLQVVEGHVETEFVPRGYAVQADLGAVSGGQASLYRRATLVRSEALRILDALVPLRPDADQDDMDSYRLMVRNGVERIVDEIGAAGGPRVQMVNMYFAGLTGRSTPSASTTADTVSGQLGSLRDRYGLVDGNVNTVEEEGVRTAYWTLVDLITDLHGSWSRQIAKFSGGSGQGFLGTELILLSRLMEAAADQVEELEDVLDSVLIAQSERRTLVLDEATGLTLDGMLTWLHDFLSHEGRRLAQEGGRDGIVSALAPMAVELVTTFRKYVADRVSGGGVFQVKTNGAPIYRGKRKVKSVDLPVVYLPASCCSLPAGMYAARTKIAVAALCRLLTDFAKTAQRIGRWAQPVLVNVLFAPFADNEDNVLVQVRTFNARDVHIPAFVEKDYDNDRDCEIPDRGTRGLLLPREASATASDDLVSAIFPKDRLNALLGRHKLPLVDDEVFVLPADLVPVTLVHGDTGRPVVAPATVSYPALVRTTRPADTIGRRGIWDDVPPEQELWQVPNDPLAESEDFSNLQPGGKFRFSKEFIEAMDDEQVVAAVAAHLSDEGIQALMSRFETGAEFQDFNHKLGEALKGAGIGVNFKKPS